MRKLLTVLLLMSVAPGAETFLVSVGVEQYDDPRITPLRYAVADARAIAAAFRAAGVPQRNVTVLTSDQTALAVRPLRVRVIAALQAVRDQAEDEDRLIVFFAGHGVEQDGQQFLLTSDARRDLVEDTALPMALIGKALKGLRAREVLFILDACRNNPDAARGDTDARLTDGLARGMRPMVVADTGPAQVAVATLLSCDVGQRAWEDPDAGHGAFTVALLNGMGGKAADDGGVVRLGKLAAYVRTAVTDWAAGANRQQTPTLINPQHKDMELLRAVTEPLITVSYEGLPLSQVCRKLTTDYGVRVALSPKVDPNARVTGRLERLGLGLALQALVAAHGLSVHRIGNAYLIAAPGDPVELPPEPPRAKDPVPAAPTMPVEVKPPPTMPAEVKPPPAAPAAPVEPVLPPIATTPAVGAGEAKPANWPDAIPWPPATDPALRFRVAGPDGMPQVLIPAGEFLMGSPDTEPGRNADESPRRKVFVSSFWMDLHPVTVAQFRCFCQAANRKMDTGSNPEDQRPVVKVSWDDACAYAAWAGRRLPSEAEWERAARAGTETAYPWGDAYDRTRAVGQQGNLYHARPVASCPPNAFGLSDIVGNVYEWCRDWYDEHWYQRCPEKDPENTTPSRWRSVRGGSWVSPPPYLRCADRYYKEPGEKGSTIGFRCVAAP